MVRRAWDTGTERVHGVRADRPRPWWPPAITCGRPVSAACPVVAQALGLGHALRRLESRREGGGGAWQHLVMLDVEQPQPALLAEGQRDEAAEFHQFRLGEMTVQTLPAGIIVRQSPRDGLRVGERRLLPVAEPPRGLEVQQVVVLGLGKAAAGRPRRALIPAVLAIHGP